MKQGWERKKLGEVCEIKYGTRVVQKRDGGSTYPVYGGGGATFKMDRYNREDCLIISRFAMSPQCVRFVKGKFFLNDSGLSVETSHPMLTQSFLNKCMVAFNYKIYSLGKGAAQRNLDVNAFKNLPIRFPIDVSIQERIVEELDCISGIIEKKKEQLKELDALPQSIFYTMFGDPVENEKGWEVKKLGEEFEVSSGGTPDTKKPLYWDNGDISWIGSNLCQNEIIYSNDGKYITEAGLAHSSAKEYKAGYVLVALVGATIGKVALLKFSTTTNQNVAGINVPQNSKCTTEFIFYLIQNLYEMFRSIGNGKFKMANLSFIRSLPIILPPLPLQQEFAKKIEAIEKQKELIRKSIGEVETLLASRMQEYFE
jgi:type I restriction enzyme S subunit